MEEYVTTRQVAVLLNVSEQTVRRYIADGTIRAVRLQDGGRYRVERGMLDAWAASRGVRLDWSLIIEEQQ